MIFEGNPEQKVEQPHHKSLEDFQAAKDGGCHLCNLIWDRIPKEIDGFKTKWCRSITFDYDWRSALSIYSKGAWLNPDAYLWVEAIKSVPGFFAI